MHPCPRCGPGARIFSRGRGAAACASCGGSFVLLPRALAAFKEAGVDGGRVGVLLNKEGRKIHRCVTCNDKMTTFEVGTESFHACLPCGAVWADAGAIERIASARPTSGPFAGLPLTTSTTDIAKLIEDSLEQSAERSFPDASDHAVRVDPTLDDDVLPRTERTIITPLTPAGTARVARDDTPTRATSIVPMPSVSMPAVPLGAVPLPGQALLTPPKPVKGPALASPAAKPVAPPASSTRMQPVMLTPPSEGLIERSPTPAITMLPRSYTPVTGSIMRPEEIEKLKALAPALEKLDELGPARAARGPFGTRRRRPLLRAAAVGLPLVVGLALFLVLSSGESHVGGGREAAFPSAPALMPVDIPLGERAAMRTYASVDGGILEATYVPGAGSAGDGAGAVEVLHALYAHVVPIGVPMRQGPYVVVHAVVGHNPESDDDAPLVGRARAVVSSTDAWVLGALAPDDGSFGRSRDAEQFFDSLK